MFNEVLEGVLDDLPVIPDKTNGAKDVKEEKILNERNSDDYGNEKQKDIIIKNIENPEDILEGIIENILKN